MSGELRNYSSGDAYALEFLGYQFSFGERDFEERVAAAAVKLGLVASNDLDADELADLVELAADARVADPRSPLGAYLVRHWERVALVDGESLVYWLRKLVFRSAYLDQRDAITGSPEHIASTQLFGKFSQRDGTTAMRACRRSSGRRERGCSPWNRNRGSSASGIRRATSSCTLVSAA